jgi:hypothetical protein
VIAETVPRRRPRRTMPPMRGSDLRYGVLTAAAVTVLGLPAGLLWRLLAPRATAVIQAEGVVLADNETKAFIGADGTFLLVTAAIGVLCGVAGYVLADRHGRRADGRASELGLALGGVLASLIAWQVGYWLTRPAFRSFTHTHHLGRTAHVYLDLRARGVLLGWAVAALVGFLLLVLLDRRSTRTVSTSTDSIRTEEPEE